MRAFALLVVAIATLPAAADPLKDCADATAPANICQVKQPPDMTEVLNRLSTKNTAWWRDGDRFTIVARRRSDRVSLCCVFQEAMNRIPGTDLWTFSVRSPLLDDAMIDIMVIASGERFVTMDSWRGPKAPTAPEHARLSALHLQIIEIDSPNLGEKRKVLIYLPPGHTSADRYPIAYVGDGQIVQQYAAALEPLILEKKLPPIILVGPYGGEGFPIPGQKIFRRNADYLLGTVEGDVFFKKYEAFFLTEVMPLAEHQFGASPLPKDRLLIGRSSGADWAIDTALRHPELFSNAAGLSPSLRRDRSWGPDKPRLFLANSRILDFTIGQEEAEQAKAAGEDVVFETHTSGHSDVMWELQFLDAVAWAFGKK